MPWTWFGFARLFRRGASAPDSPQGPDLQEAANSTSRREANKPIEIVKLKEFIFQPITVKRERRMGRKVDYSQHLMDRQIKPRGLKFLSSGSIVFLKLSLISQFICALFLSIGSGFALSCSEHWWSLGCQTQVSYETATATVQREGRAGLRAWRETTSKQIRSEPQEREFFNFVVFQAILVAFAFSLGFARWQTGNRQAALNSVFDRKKELNLLFLDDGKKQLLEPLIRGATDPDEMIQAKGETTASENEAVAILDKCQSIDELGSSEIIDIGRKVFVFMELDNLEFAHEKYYRGYLDAEQMHRACEILESRCLNNEFRYLAATQGLVYYNRDFHCIVAACIVRGYLLSGGEIPAVTDPR